MEFPGIPAKLKPNAKPWQRIARRPSAPWSTKMKKSNYLSLAIVLLFSSGIAGSIFSQELPNILWITSEDNGPHLGCYGDTYSVSPNIDRLAGKGMIYTNAISNAPVCAPARTTIISGIYPPSTGGQHMRSQVRLPRGFRMYPQYLRAAGYYCTNNSKEDYNLEKPGKVWDDSSRKAHWKNRPKGKPFFAIFNHTISHESQIRNAIDPRNRIHDPSKVRVPAYHPDTPNVRKNWAQYYDRITMMDKRVGQNLKELEDAGLAEETIIFYYGDHGSGMPRSKRWPYNSGLQVPMIVYFPKKWEHLAPREYRQGGASERLVGFIDLAPTLLSLAGIKPPKWMQGTAFAGKFETDEPRFSYGFRGRMDERNDMVRTVRGKRYIYIRNYMPHRPYGQFVSYMFETQTTQDWFRLYNEGKLNPVQSAFWITKPAEELYDLKNDPDETRNLADSPEHQKVLERMRQAHADWAREIRDLGFLSEWEFHHRAGDSTPYEMGHNPKLFDFETIFAAAQLATSMKEDKLSDVIKLLEHDDPAVRYWGTIGILCYKEKGYQKAVAKLRAALKDPSPIVQINAAEALGRYGSQEDVNAALQILLKHAAPESDVFLAIWAWNALDYLDEKALPVFDRIKSLSPNPLHAAPRVSKYSVRLKEKVVADLKKFKR